MSDNTFTRIYFYFISLTQLLFNLQRSLDFRKTKTGLMIYFTEIIKMPLPNYGYANKEKKTHQDIVFEMAPEIVSDDDETQIIDGKKVKRVRGKVE